MALVRKASPGCAQNAYPYKGDAMSTLIRRAARTGWRRCHDLGQEMDYSDEGMKMTIYVVSGWRIYEDKCMDERIKFKQKIKTRHAYDFIGYL